jgi:hypothetical protein
MIGRVRRALLGAGAIAVVAAATPPLAARLARDRFDHEVHKDLFPSCLSCHGGIQEASGPADPGVWPDAAACATCHDGSVEPRVNWEPPAIPRTNLRFSHPRHASELAESPFDSTARCQACHAEVGTDRMDVRLAVADNCISCHQLEGPHLDVADAECATCHSTLAQAVRLTADDIAGFPRPASHQLEDFAERAHARLARAGPGPVAASCATCHAQNFCTECHVNAPEVAAIRALDVDPRIAERAAPYGPPASHLEPEFARSHGRVAGDGSRRCVTCHTQESCLVCHVGTPRVADRLMAASPERPHGARTERRRPSSHGADFSATHAEAAAAAPATCAACHGRPQCLDCHVPNAAAASPGYHRTGFLATHPVEAYQRTAACSDCHNPQQFCSSCHVSAGLASAALPLDAGYHDAKRFFSAGHGQAARQNLESCVSCHTETDCMSCHATSTQGGRNFSPHGPGFDADRLRQRNPQMCTACHGGAIP